MIDIHLINMALAWVGIAAGAAIALAALIIGIAAIAQHRSRSAGVTGTRVTTTNASAEVREPAMREPALH
jgi:hypothetical protein